MSIQDPPIAGTNRAAGVVQATAAATRYSLSRNDRTSAVLSFTDAGEVVYVSDRGRKLLRREPGATAHESIANRLARPDEIDAFTDALRQVGSGERSQMTITLHLDGDGESDGPVVECTALDLRTDPQVKGLIATVNELDRA